MEKYLKSYFLLVFVFLFSQQQSNPRLTINLKEEQLKNISDEFLNGIEQVLNDSANILKLEKILTDIRYDKVPITGKTMMDTFVHGLKETFNAKTAVIEKIRNQAREANFNKEKSEDENYLNMREIKDYQLTMDESFSTTIKVNMSNSFVQVPTNIYSLKTEVLDTAKWTKNLDSTFRSNFDTNNDSLLFQYYGDSSGILRIYPGNVIRMKEEGEKPTDLFDCRRRIWYIQASASPKDVVIVIDLSGSMIGNNIGIAKIASSSLIDTLQENDFFTVITVNNQVEYVHPCVKNLIQATKENKEMMKREIQNMSAPSNIIDVDVGMKEAFKILQEDQESNITKRQTTDCNQAIMFITDGIEGDYAGKATFEEYNKEKIVRVFSFLVGRMKSPNKEALLKMSCDNRGHFYSIETLGNVWDTVLDYLHVMSRPFAKAYNKVKPSYTPAYLDSAGFGMIMSVSISVFSKTVTTDGDGNEIETHDKLIGVAGTDISLKNLMDHVPLSKLGPFSHGFVINNNGFVLIHPKFRKQVGYLPSPPNIVIEHLELSVNTNKSEELKRKMLNMISNVTTTGTDQFWTYYIYDNDRKVFTLDTNYTYERVSETDFVAGIAIQNASYYLKIKGEQNDFTDGIMALNATKEIHENENRTGCYVYVKVAPWNYCSNVKPGSDKPKGIKTYPDASVLFKELDPKKFGETCDDDQELVSRLLVPAGLVHEETERWQLINSTVNMIFLATSGGFLKYMTVSNDTNIDRDVVHTDIFQNAAANPSASWVMSTPQRNGKPSTNEAVDVTVMKSIRHENIVTSVVGAKMSSNFINEIFENATRDVYSECQNNNTALCAIIDHNAFIVASNQHNKFTGRYVFQKLGIFFDYLVTKGLFEKIMLGDAQAECDIPDDFGSSANILLTPAKIIVNAVIGFSKAISWLTIQLGLFVISLMQHVSVDAQVPRTIPISCTKTMPFYKATDKLLQDGKEEGFFDCSKGAVCSKLPYSLYVIPDTNLILLIVRVRENCVCFDIETQSSEPAPPSDPEDWCPSKRKPMYRKQPTSCFKSTAEETGNETCGRASHVSLSLSLTVAMLLCTIYSTFAVSSI